MQHKKTNRKPGKGNEKAIEPGKTFLHKRPLDFAIPDLKKNTPIEKPGAPGSAGKPTHPRLMFRQEDDESCGHGICTSYVSTETLFKSMEAFRKAGFGKVTLSNDSAPVREVREYCGEKTAQMLKTTLDEIHSSYPGSDTGLRDLRMKLRTLYEKHSYRMAEIADSGVKRGEKESAQDFIVRLEALVKQK